jgi:hypothetical protein
MYKTGTEVSHRFNLIATYDHKVDEGLYQTEMAAI